MSRTGLIGSTGFVGGLIAAQRHVDVAYHRPDVHLVRGQTFGTLWLAGAPAQKWVANSDPDADAAGLTGLVEHLREARAETVVLVSTVDVYPQPVGVDERTPVAATEHREAYGRNRHALEVQVREIFDRVLVVRLPGLFGSGLRKNLVFDLVHERDEYAHRDSLFQFYDMSGFCDDADRALAAGLDLVNLATEPLAAHEVARKVFGRELHRTQGDPVAYDMRTCHADVFGRPGSSYLHGRDEVLARLEAFAEAERGQR